MRMAVMVTMVVVLVTGVIVCRLARGELERLGVEVLRRILRETLTAAVAAEIIGGAAVLGTHRLGGVNRHAAHGVARSGGGCGGMAVVAVTMLVLVTHQ
jgi:hypothetical protein